MFRRLGYLLVVLGVVALGASVASAHQGPCRDEFNQTLVHSNAPTGVGGSGDECVGEVHGTAGSAASNWQMFGGWDNVESGQFGDVVHGGDGGDWIWGGAGGDTIHGNAGNDDLYEGYRIGMNGQSADSLYGDNGTDLILAGCGADFINGGSGVDELIHFHDSAADTIQNIETHTTHVTGQCVG